MLRVGCSMFSPGQVEHRTFNIEHRRLKRPSPRPSPGVPGEGVRYPRTKGAIMITRRQVLSGAAAAAVASIASAEAEDDHRLLIAEKHVPNRIGVSTYSF